MPSSSYQINQSLKHLATNMLVSLGPCRPKGDFVSVMLTYSWYIMQIQTTVKCTKMTLYVYRKPLGMFS
jgi:hypothetical protein